MPGTNFKVRGLQMAAVAPGVEDWRSGAFAAQVARRFAGLGAVPRLREGFVTDNGGVILDVQGLAIDDPARLEAEISQWPGVVCCGIFARNRASICLLGTLDGVRTLMF